jgi:hypothetical protein
VIKTRDYHGVAAENVNIASSVLMHRLCADLRQWQFLVKGSTTGRLLASSHPTTLSCLHRLHTKIPLLEHCYSNPEVEL